MNEEQFDHLLEEIRGEMLPATEQEAIKTRVKHNLGLPTVADLEADFPAYVAGTLPPDRRLLLEDQLSRNVALRKRFEQFRGTAKVVALPEAKRPFTRKWLPVAAAAAGLAVAAYAGRETLDAWFAPSGPRATIASAVGQSLVVLANGTVLPVGSMNVTRENPGVVATALQEGDRIETGAGARVVLALADGSKVEMNERSSLMVRAAWSGQSIHLQSGDVIVQAAKQKRGKLRVVTRDTTASVKGTIFAVSAGMAGSLVSVVEGAVEVEHGETDRLVRPGQQEGTAAILQTSDVKEAVAWSQEAERFQGLLAEFGQLEKAIAALPAAAIRTNSSLVQQLPADMLAFAAMPNVSTTMQQTMTLVEQRLSNSGVLREWWVGSDGQSLRQLVDRLQVLSSYLGDEIVFSLLRDPANASNEVGFLFAKVKAGNAAALRTALDNLAKEMGATFAYEFRADTVVITGKAAQLAYVSSRLGTGGDSAFRQEIQARYARGVAWIAGANLELIMSNAATSDRGAVAGFSNARFAFFEQETVNGVDSNETVLSFRGARTGVASWLAAPASGAAAEYISTDAIAAGAAVTKTPRQAYDELVNLASRVNPSLPDSIRMLEQRMGINIGNDLANSLGTNFAVALESVSLPSPGWTLTAEVLRPTTLDESIRRLVTAINTEMANAGASNRLEFQQEVVNGRQWNRLSATGQLVSLHWTYDRGYLVMSSDRAYALRAISTRNGGFPLIRSSKFTQQLPPAASVHYSGFLWVNSGGVFSGLLASITNPSLRALIENRDPILIAMLAGTEQISAHSRNRLSSVVLDALSLATSAAPTVQQKGISPKAAPKTLKKLQITNKV